MATLDPEQRRALHVLAHLFFRMGVPARARRFYAVLAEDPADALAHAGLAACLVELGDGEEALRHIREAMKGGVLSTSQTPLLLLKARALWILGRCEEAREARGEFLHASGLARKAMPKGASADGRNGQ